MFSDSREVSPVSGVASLILLYDKSNFFKCLNLRMFIRSSLPLKRSQPAMNNKQRTAKNEQRRDTVARVGLFVNVSTENVGYIRRMGEWRSFR